MTSQKRRGKNPTSLTPEACQEDEPHVGSREKRVLCVSTGEEGREEAGHAPKGQGI